MNGLRRFRRAFGRFAAIAALSAGALPAVAQRPLRNVVVIVGDDHATHALGAYGSTLARTPNLDRLAAGGMRFDRAYASSPVCTPSRQALLTGRLPHAVGVTLLPTPLSIDQVTLADHLAERGFRTAAIGKMHFNSNRDQLRRWGFAEEVIRSADDYHGFKLRVDRREYQQHLAGLPPRPLPQGVRVREGPIGFDHPRALWNVDNLPGPTYDDRSEGRFFADQAIDFLARNRDGPFLLWLGFNEPHAPFNYPVELAGRYDPARMPLPAVGREDERWIPAIFTPFTEVERRGVVAAYHASVQHLDANVGRVLDALDRLGLASNTLVVYLGDHGYLLGHHGRFEKHTMWEEAVRAPLLVRAGAPSTTGASPALVEFIDVAPTVLAALGVEPMPTAQGRSFHTLLSRPSAPHRETAFSEFLPDETAMIRDARWKYVFSAGSRDLAQGYETGQGPAGVTHRLYDLAADPAETRSLATEPAHRDTLRRLQDAMIRRFRETHPAAGHEPAGLSRDALLTWYTQPPDPPALAHPDR